ncbi:DNA gyrase, A subunit [Filifactor alocis ATCC 35896]|uniref:DNA gyrase subunit A n=1 Tax=Filifactor alocis (strain ATCC 35896 / CCUG 47790 / D40 B5) TaxID=546269 RepID=D6GSU6_FILAD|nr:DNA gyrase subunit A [Filifactor alocis]EFE27931.2 DNA gyrase, A subunit [Filifactor alocis ATCC 35896]
MSQEEMRDKIIEVDLKHEMEQSYIEYAMSVIVGRALPDVRDGLKPVHRRILYSMGQNNLTPDKPYRKSATIVGDVLGKYHPHGDTAVYDALVKMAQDFSMRYPLVDGHGNFGSIDGDSAAAMRYTESRMEKLSMEMLRDLNKETVDMVPNYDENEWEPSVLPARYPNLLVNGSNGIAVGMATSIPPHNLGEVIDAVVELIDNEDATLEDILKHIKGPDFPTGAHIMGNSSMLQAYRTGRGKVVQRAKTSFEEMSGGKTRIVVTEIPYQVNKARLVEKIAELMKDKRIDGITHIGDESNRKGMRIVIELRRDVNPDIVLNQLFKFSPLQQVFSIIMLALVNNIPKVLTLEQMLRLYLKHQEEVVTRRTQFDLKKAQDRIHLVEGLLKAIDHIDEVIAIIRSSYSDAMERLMERFDFSEIQAKAILDMQLRRLQGLEKEKLEDEQKDLQQKIDYYQEILSDRSLLLSIIKEEILEIKAKYGNERRTTFLASYEDIDIKDMIPDDEVTVTLTHLGYIKRVGIDTYKTQKRGGKGIASMSTRDEDFVDKLLLTSNHSKVIFFTNMGRIYRLNTYEIPESSRTAKGTNIVNILPLEDGEKVNTMLSIREEQASSGFVVMCTRKGIMKKTPLEEFQRSNRNGLIAISLKEDDELIGVELTDGNCNIICVARNGKAIMFDESDIRSMGRTAQGVRAMNLEEGDEIVSMMIADPEKDVLIISERGYGKRTPIAEYNLQTRGGKGSRTYKITEKTGRLVGGKVVSNDDEIMIVNIDGTLIRMEVKGISVLSRVTSGVRLMKTAENQDIASFEKIEISEEEE